MAYRVLPVPGRLVLHPGSIGAPQKHMVGHARGVNEDDTRYDPTTGTQRPMTTYTPRAEAVTVPEYEGYYFRRAILDGDLDYVATVVRLGTPAERDEAEEALVAATARHRLARGEERTVAQQLAETEPPAPASAPAQAAPASKTSKTKG